MKPGDADPFDLLESLRDLRSSALRPLESGYDALDALVAVCRNSVPAADVAAISYARPRPGRSGRRTGSSM